MESDCSTLCYADFFPMIAITSRQNSVVRAFRELADAPDPSGARVLLDGLHLVREAHAAGVIFEAIAVGASQLEANTEEAMFAHTLEREHIEIISASDPVLAAMSPVKTPSGIVAVGLRQPTTASAICGKDNAFILVAVDVQDPGNLGSLIRAAEAGGANGMLVCGASANPFSWKSLRGSMGSALRLPVAGGLSVEDAMASVQAGGMRMVAAVPRNGRTPDAVDWSGRVALFIGGEGPGLSRSVVAAADQRVAIPMAPPVESLNVAVAGAILIYAASWQRTP